MYQYTESDPPSKYDLIETRHGYCKHCEANVEIVEVDHGIGRGEAWGRPFVHIDMQDECVVCGSTDLEGERAEECDE